MRWLSQAGADGICSTGFASISTLDAGFFGRGIYTSTHAQYACEYSAGVHNNGAGNPPNAAGALTLLH